MSEIGAKGDKQKLRLSLVPRGIVEAVAAIREYGTQKYGNPDNWRTVEVQRFHDAALRHMEAAREDYMEKDPESGYPHLWHVACNLAFIFSLVPDMGESAEERLINWKHTGTSIAIGKSLTCNNCGNYVTERSDTVPGLVHGHCPVRDCILYDKWVPKQQTIE